MSTGEYIIAGIMVGTALICLYGIIDMLIQFKNYDKNNKQ